MTICSSLSDLLRRLVRWTEPKGPPGTGKTASTMAPSLLARACWASLTGNSLNVLVTAPSNTAIDELLEDTAEILEETTGDGRPFDHPTNIELVRVGSKPSTLPDNVEYIDYNRDAHAGKVDRVADRLQANTHTGTQQISLGEYGTAGADEADAESAEAAESDEDAPITIVFTTIPSGWKFLEKITPGSSPDSEEVVTQSVWDVLAADEASMLEIPDFLHAGTAFRPHGQVLVAGDHRQLPPVQKADWDEVRRRDLRATAAYLSTLDYLRLLRGTDVIEDAPLEGFECDCDREAVDLPLVQLETTYRFDDRVASLMERTVYSKDGIPYESALDPASYEPKTEPPEAVAPIFDGETSVALITYDPKKPHQQSNPIESIITQSLIQYTSEESTVGVVTPHNAHRGSLLSQIPTSKTDSPDKGWREISPRDTQIETVNRFQGGERDVMMLNGTVSDPSYIEAESEFLLNENRINVSLTRHSKLLVVIVAESIIGHMPSDPDLYDEASIWKVLSSDLGEAPTVDDTADWSDDLGEFLGQTGWTGETVPTEPFVSEGLLPSSVSVYTL